MDPRVAQQCQLLLQLVVGYRINKNIGYRMINIVIVQAKTNIGFHRVFKENIG